MIAAQATSNRRNAALLDHDAPEHHVGPAEVLAHDGADEAERRADLEAVKKNGSAAGTRTFRNTAISTRRRRSASARARTARPGQAAHGVDHDRKEDERRRRSSSCESGLVTPNQLFMIGAKAMIGIALAATANGMSAPRERGQARDARTATMRPAVTPMTNPPSGLDQRDLRGRGSGQAVVHFSMSAAADGRRRRQQEPLDVASSRTTTSHTTITPTKSSDCREVASPQPSAPHPRSPSAAGSADSSVASPRASPARSASRTSVMSSK